MSRSRSKSKNVTSHDVAKRAGVSQATVSLAMRGSDQVSQERIEQIRQIAREMGYFPRAAGQMLRNRKTGYLGLIIAAEDPDMAVSSGFMGPLLARFVRTFTQMQIPYLVDFHHHTSSDHALPKQVTSGLVDGVLVVGDVGQQFVDAMQSHGRFPLVSVGELSDYCVLNDADGAIESAVGHLHDLGHRRIAYAGGPEIYQEHLESRLAFEKSVAQLGLTDQPDDWIQVFALADTEPEYARYVYQWARQILLEADRPTALICRSEPIARSVLYAAAQLGIRVPDELNIVSWGWDSEASRRYPALTTLAYSIDTIVEQAMQVMLPLVAHQAVKAKTIRVPMQLVIGDTTGPLTEA